MKKVFYTTSILYYVNVDVEMFMSYGFMILESNEYHLFLDITF